MKVAFLETIEECYYFFENFSFEDYRLISFNVEVSLFLKNKKKEFIDISDLIDEESYFEAKVKSEEIITKLIERLNTFSSLDSGLSIGNYFYFQIYNTIGALHYKSYILAKVMSFVEPSEIVLSECDIKSIIYGFRQPIFGVYYHILRNSSYTVSLVKLAPRKKLNKNLLMTLKGVVARCLNSYSIRLFTLYKNLRHFGYIPLSLKADKILLMDPLYNWEECLEVLRDKYSLYFFKGETFYFNGKLIAEIDSIFREFLLFEEYNYYNIYQMQIDCVCTMYAKMKRKRASFDKKTSCFNFLLCSIAPYPFQGYICDLFLKAGKNVYFYQHGEMNLYDDSLFPFASEINFCSHYLSFGESVNEKYDKYVDDVLSVGSVKLAVLQESFKSIKVKKKPVRILYVTSKYLYQAVPFVDSFLPDKALINSQRGILSFLATLGKDYQVTFRPSNTFMFNNMFIDIPANILIASDTSFVELLTETDLVIIDSPSTTVLEAACTDLPIFCLLNRMNWFESAELDLRKRAVVCRSVDDLIESLKRFLNSGYYGPNVYDKSFINNYGINNSDKRLILEKLSRILI